MTTIDFPNSPSDGYVYTFGNKSWQWNATGNYWFAVSTTVGYVGSLGYTGSSGAYAALGYTGSQGALGYAGSKGDIGYAGSQGVIGYSGSKGDIGYTGSQGYSGSQGVVGYAGSFGSLGYTGSFGNTGFTGSQGFVGYTGSFGSLGYTGSTGVGYTGSQGVDGFIGHDGYTGSIGFTGSVGAGYTGSKGDLGYTGSTGAGYVGSQGDLGYTGSFGNTGYTGSYGPIAGSDQQIIFNDNGYANGSPGLVFIKSSNTLSVNGSMYISGNIYITGNVTTFAANNLDIVDNMIYLNSNSNFANPDIGFAANYNDGIYHHTGFFRDHTNGRWKIFENYLPEPQASQYIDQSNQTFRYADFQANTIYANSVSTNTLLTTGSTTFNQTVTIANNINLIANGSSGSAGYVLAVNSTGGTFWSTIATLSGAGGFSNGQSITVNTFNASGTSTFNANLTVNAISTFNSNVVVSNTSTITSQNYIFTSNAMTLATNSFTTYATTLNSSQYIGIGSGTASILACGNGYGFVIEFFIKFNTLSTTSTMTPLYYDDTSGGGRPGSYWFYANTTAMASGQGNYAAGTWTLPNLSLTTGVWYHMAWIGQNNDMYWAINGTVYDLNTTPGNGNFGTSYPYTISGLYNLSNASYSNIRIISNNNIYSINGFVPPTGPLNAPPGTALLNFQSSTFNDSITGSALTTTGSPTLSSTTINQFPVANNNLISGAINNGNAFFRTITSNYIQTPKFIAYGSNGAITTTTISNGFITVGSSTTNTTINATAFAINGNILPSNNYFTANFVSNNYLSTANLVFSGNVSIQNTITIGNSSVYTLYTSNYITIGNTTVNTTINTTAFSLSNSTISNAIVTPIQTLTVAMTDEITPISTGNKLTMRAPYAMKLVSPYIRPSLTTTGSTTTTVDITSGGTSIFSTTPTLPSGISSNTGPALMSATGLATIADDTQLVFSVSTAGTSATGLKVNIYYVKV